MRFKTELCLSLLLLICTEESQCKSRCDKIDSIGERFHFFLSNSTKGCRLKYIQGQLPILLPGFFPDDIVFVHMNLRQIGLTSIAINALNFEEVVELLLESNNLVQINRTTFAISSANASENFLKAALPKLEILTLNDNPIIVVNELAFSVLPKLKKLFLFHTHLITLELIMTNTASIYLSSVKKKSPCMINFLQIDRHEGEWCDDQKDPVVQLIDANGCPIESFHYDSEVFELVNRTQIVRYPDQHCHKTFDLSSFPGMSQINIYSPNVTLHLAGRNLSNWDWVLDGTQNIVILDLSDNKLTSFNFSRFPNLKSLNLTDNEIHCLDIPEYTRLETIDLVGNPITFECTKYLKKYCKSSNVTIYWDWEFVKSGENGTRQPLSFQWDSHVSYCGSPGHMIPTTTTTTLRPILRPPPRKKPQQSSLFQFFEIFWTCLLFVMTIFVALHALLVYMRWRKNKLLTPSNEPIITQDYNQLESELY